MAISNVEIKIAPEVSQFLAQPRKLLTDGQWVAAASGKTFPVYNPATGEVMAQVAEGDTEDIDRAVRAARKAFEGGPWRKMTPSERGQAIYRLANLVEQHSDEFAQLESLDNGKPLAVDASQEQGAYRVMGALRILVQFRNQELRVLVQCRSRRRWMLCASDGGVRYLNGVLRDKDGSWVIDGCDVVALERVARCLPAAYQFLLAPDSDDWHTLGEKAA